MTETRPPRPSTPGHSRRTFLSGAAGGALALGLAGCGGGSDEQASSGGEGGRFPVRIRHKFGTTEITEAPRRVACIGYIDADTILALGVQPVMLRTNAEQLTRGVGPWIADRLPDPPPPVIVGELDLERLAAQRPDVIISVTDELDRRRYERLSQLAPTVAPPPGFPEYGVPWDVATVAQASALGRRADGERLVRRTRAALAQARRTIAAPQGATAAVLAADAGKFYVFADSDVRGNLIRELGLRQPPAITREVGEEFYAEISEERLDILEDADVIVNLSYGGGVRQLERSQAWTTLPQVREGRVASTRGVAEGIAAQTGTSVSIPYVLPRLAPRLRDAFARVRS